MEDCEGNVEYKNSGAARILGTVNYEGTVRVNGLARGGVCAILTRLSTLAKHSLIVRDNHPFIVTDFYIEQAQVDTILLCGRKDIPAGRITMTLPKLNIGKATNDPNGRQTLIAVKGYYGDISLVSGQFYSPNHPVEFAFDSNDLNFSILGSYFYTPQVSFVPAGFKLGMLYNQSSVKQKNIDTANKALAEKSFSLAVEDFRKAGLLDWSIQYPGVK